MDRQDYRFIDREIKTSVGSQGQVKREGKN